MESLSSLMIRVDSILSGGEGCGNQVAVQPRQYEEKNERPDWPSLPK